jgi:hypothetical protein
MTTPRTTPGHPRAHIRTTVLLCRTTDVPPRGRVGRAGIDLHLGQKTKLGGRYADDSLIYISYFVGSLYIHVSLSFYFVASCFYSCFPKHKKDQKYFRCFSLFVSLAFFLWFALLAIFGLVFEKSKNILLCWCSFCSCFKNQKPKNIYCSSLVL